MSHGEGLDPWKGELGFLILYGIELEVLLTPKAHLQVRD